jgi:hypothetical protein
MLFNGLSAFGRGRNRSELPIVSHFAQRVAPAEPPDGECSSVPQYSPHAFEIRAAE